MAVTGVRGMVCIYRMNDTDTPATTEAQLDETQKLEMGSVPYDAVDGVDAADAVDGRAPLSPDNRTGIVAINPHLTRTANENPAPHLDESRRPDTGFGGSMYTFTLMFNEQEIDPDSNGPPIKAIGDTGYDPYARINVRAKGIALLYKWAAESNTIRGVFEYGRFGVRNNYRPEFDVHPGADRGLKLKDFSIDQQMLVRGLIKATVVLELDGPPIEPGA